MDSVSQAESYFKDDIFATETMGITILQAEESYAKCKVKIDSRHLNARGFVMGGAIFTLADFTFAVASNSENTSVVSLNSTINFIKPAKCEYLFCEAKPIKNGKNVCFYTITITDENSNVIAYANTTGYAIKK